MKKVFAIIMALICCGNLVTEVGAMNLNIIEKENIKITDKIGVFEKYA